MPAPPLEYAPLPRSSLRRRWTRRAIWLLLLIVLAAVSVNRKPISDHIALLYAQHRAMNYSAPAGQIVFTSDAEQAKMLVASSAGYIWTFPNQPPVVRPEPIWISFNRLLLPGVAAPPAATVFCHQMRTPAGKRRLVALNLIYNGPWSNVPIFFNAMVIEPGATLFSKPGSLKGTVCEISYHSMILAIQRTRIFAGQIDAADPTHFTIPYQIGDRPGIMDARLQDDDTLVITVRSGPATRVLSSDQRPVRN